MPRRVEDIVPGDRRSIRDIPVGREGGREVSREKEPVDSVRPRASSPRSQPEKKNVKMKDEVAVKIHRIGESDEKTEQNDRPKNDNLRRMAMTPPVAKKKGFRRKGVWLTVTLGAIVVVAAAAFLASTFFSRAVFTVTPKVIPVVVNSTLVIKTSPVADPNDLSYEVITMRSSASSTVPATDGPVVSTKAEGSIDLYNAYSATSIRLIAGTRLSGDSGRVYRLQSSVVIPGYTKPASSGSSIMPGSIETDIIADQAGPDYNISRTDSISDFKIVAYKGTTKYDSVYARLVSDVTGGATGTKKTVNASILASSTAALKASILSSLIQQVKSSVPAGYVMYDGSYTSSFSSPTVGGTDKASAVLTIQGTVYGIIMKRVNFISKLASAQAVSTFGNFGFTAPGLEQLSFNISNIKDFAPDKHGTLIIAVKGNMKLIGTVPVDRLKKDLAGKSLADSQSVLKTYSPVIENADGELVPPWSKIPTDLSRIEVNVTGE